MPITNPLKLRELRCAITDSSEILNQQKHDIMYSYFGFQEREGPMSASIRDSTAFLRHVAEELTMASAWLPGDTLYIMQQCFVRVPAETSDAALAEKCRVTDAAACTMRASVSSLRMGGGEEFYDNAVDMSLGMAMITASLDLVRKIATPAYIRESLVRDDALRLPGGSHTPGDHPGQGESRVWLEGDQSGAGAHKDPARQQHGPDGTTTRNHTFWPAAALMGTCAATVAIATVLAIHGGKE